MVEIIKGKIQKHSSITLISNESPKNTFVAFTCHKIRSIQQKIDSDRFLFIERTFDGGTYRLAHHEQRGRGGGGILR